MQITAERMTQLRAIIGTTPIQQWHLLVRAKKMNHLEWAQLCRMNYQPPAPPKHELAGQPQKPFKMPEGTAPWNADAFEREMT